MQLLLRRLFSFFLSSCVAGSCCSRIEAHAGALPRRSSVPVAAARLRFFYGVSASLAAVVVKLKRMLVPPRRSSVPAAAVPVSLAAVVVELKRMLVLPRRSSVPAAAAPLRLCFVVTLSLLRQSISC